MTAENAGVRPIPESERIGPIIEARDWDDCRALLAANPTLRDCCLLRRPDECTSLVRIRVAGETVLDVRTVGR